jgi:hypothetical protein
MATRRAVYHGGMKRIRAFESGDLATIQSIRKRAFQPIHDSFRTLVGERVFQLEFCDWDQKQGAYLQSICAKNSGKEVYVAALEDKIVGFIGLSIDENLSTRGNRPECGRPRAPRTEDW